MWCMISTGLGATKEHFVQRKYRRTPFPASVRPPPPLLPAAGGRRPTTLMVRCSAPDAAETDFRFCSDEPDFLGARVCSSSLLFPLDVTWAMERLLEATSSPMNSTDESESYSIVWKVINNWDYKSQWLRGFVKKEFCKFLFFEHWTIFDRNAFRRIRSQDIILMNYWPNLFPRHFHQILSVNYYLKWCILIERII